MGKMSSQTDTIGSQISYILEHLEAKLWDYEYHNGTPPGFTEAGFRASIKLFMACSMERMYALQKAEGIELQDACAMAEKLGSDVRNLVKVYCDFDTHDFYK